MYILLPIFFSPKLLISISKKTFQYGDEGGVTYNRNPYSDYTDYQPVNTAYKVRLKKTE